MPVVFGETYTLAFSVLYGAALVPLPLALWLWGPLSLGFALFAVSLGGWFFLKLFGCFLDHKSYQKTFLASLVYILVLVAALMADILL
jgi:heme O synthase-like polyprenyltransferase